ncbi:MAG TPA: type II toxin-antitoxin system VapC family toxin [Tepidisphaeraceae bacterium]|nr:type II toxin-antitoxin system VapC family toxin [Tepidisphaeraceae bacterium]
MILVDTNIPLRIAQVGHPHRQIAMDALQLLTLRDEEHFAIAPQSLYEMYVVLTRPANVNGFGMTASGAAAEIAATRALFELLPETAQVYPTWEGLIATHGTMGKRAHDVRLVALMIQHRVARILTFNDAEFRSFTEIEPLNPFDVTGKPRS